MHIVAGRSGFIPIWMHTEVLERLWRATGSPYVAIWRGAPVFPDWFVYEHERPVAFKTGDLVLRLEGDQARVTFVDGRHRTRWLMGRLALVPVGLEAHRLDQALALGLAFRQVEPEDSFPTFDYH